jgi:hypothetical protein
MHAIHTSRQDATSGAVAARREAVAGFRPHAKGKLLVELAPPPPGEVEDRQDVGHADRVRRKVVALRVDRSDQETDDVAGPGLA